jgi:hypothetical protein
MTTPLLSLSPALSNIFRALTAHLSLSLSTLQAFYKSPLCLARSLSLCTRSTLQITAVPRSLALSLHIHIYIYIYIYIYIHVYIHWCVPRSLSLSLAKKKELTTHLTWLSLVCTRISGPRDAFGASPHARTGWGPVGRAKILREVAVLLVCASLARCLFLFLSLHVHIYIYIYVCIHIYMHTYIHIYTHICISHI